MAHKLGDHVGGVRSIEDVRLRCVMSDECDCWHLRTAYGRPQPRGRVHRLWVHGVGTMSATQAVWVLAHQRAMNRGHRAVRTCKSYDCANPAHIKSMSHSDAQRHIVGTGADMTPARQAQLRRLHSQRRIFCADKLIEIRSSPESAVSLAQRYGCSPVTVRAARRGVTYREGLAGGRPCAKRLCACPAEFQDAESAAARAAACEG